MTRLIACNSLSLLVFLLLCLVPQAVSQGQDPAKPVTVPPLVKTTHVYKTVGNVPISADVYRPADQAVRPVVVWIHGGALIVGSRSQVPKNVLELCTRERFIFVSLDYRLAPEVKLPEIATDLQDAFKWLHAQGPQLFQADTSRIVVTGGSAGGFLTMLSGALIEPRPTALVAYWGYGDIDAKWATDASEHYRTKTPPVDPKAALAAVNRGQVLTNTDDPMVQKARSSYYLYLRQTGGWSREVTGINASIEPDKLKPFCPVQLIKPDYPPILMIHGTEDTDVPYACSVKMDAELTRQGIEHTLVTIPGAEHGLRDGDPKLIAAANAQALEFIRKHLAPIAVK
jgi:acetyl esterase/lipase